MKVFLFFVGLLAMYRVHIIGMIGISEILICAMAPFLYFKNYALLKRDGFLTMANLMLLCCVGCVIASWYNHTPFFFWIRGLATPVVFFCSFVFFHHFLRKDFGALKWLIVGLSLSSVLGLLGGTLGEETDAVLNDESGYYTTVLLAPLFSLPIVLFYQKLPWQISFLLSFSSGLFKILTSVSGRSAALGSFAAALLIYIGQKSVRKMARVKKNFLLFFILGVIGIFVAKGAYTHAAASGWLGEKSQQKYLDQTQGNNSMMSVLIGGRAEAFICISAALDHPIVGFGPWALDTGEYSRRFRQKYGNFDWEEDAKHERYLAQMGLGRGVSYIPFHSHIFGNWVWYGIFGLLMWVYIIYLIIKFFKKAPDAIPQWWPLIATGLPSMLWHIFFSPFGTRVSTAVTVCGIVFALKMASKNPFDPGPEFWRERAKYLP